MIIPIRCFTCGKVLANKWNAYVHEVEKLEAGLKEKNGEQEEAGIELKNFEPALKKEILDRLGLKKMCCRRHMLTHVDMIDII